MIGEYITKLRTKKRESKLSLFETLRRERFMQPF
jgi:hypothetical protein